MYNYTVIDYAIGLCADPRHGRRAQGASERRPHSLSPTGAVGNLSNYGKTWRYSWPFCEKPVCRAPPGDVRWRIASGGRAATSRRTFAGD